jgi:flagellar hook-length control protein FliK
MTTPCSLPGSLPVALPGVSDAGPATPGSPDDAFAAVLAMLSGALGVPVPQATQPVDVPQEGTGAAPAVDGPGATVEAPGAWAAATQRQGLPGIVAVPQPTTPVDESAPVDAAVVDTAPASPSSAAPGQVRQGPVGPTHATHGTEVRATRPAGEHAPFVGKAEVQQGSDAELPAVPAGPEAPTTAPVDAPPPLRVEQQAPVTATAPNQQPAAVDAPHATKATRHVQQAVLEAARGLRHEGGGRTSLVVRLDPPELGAVLVRLTVQDGRVDVQLRTPDLAARADLQSQSYDVQQVLRDQGFDLSSFDVAHGDVFPGNQGDSPDRGTPQRSHRADGRLDDHHPVTDDGPATEPSGTWL